MLFRNDNIEKEYREDGFVRLPLLQVNELATIKDLYHRTYGQSFQGLQPLLRVGDAKRNIELHYEIARILSPILEKWFLPFAYNANHFIVKGANDSNTFRLHQDWNVVNETKYIAAHIWIALQDTDTENGALFVLRGSHRYFDNIRSGSCGIAFIEDTETIRKHITSLPVKAGEAIVYQQALFHGSHPNSTPDPRLACISSIRPQQASMVYYQQDLDKLIEHEISPEILLNQLSQLEKGSRPMATKSSINNFYPCYKTSYLSTKVLEEKLIT